MAFDLQPLITEITNAGTVMDGATIFVQSVPGLISDAVAKATANGATAAELQPVVDLGTALQAKADALTAAMTAGTSTPPPSPESRRR